MFVGPIFTRELVTAPRRGKLYVARAAYVAALFLLMCTAWMVMAGRYQVSDLGDVARFGAAFFQILAPLQLALALFFSALQVAGAVCHEKDRRTLVLLLLTNLHNHELVLGKLTAGLLAVVALLVASLPLFMLTVLFGGVSFEQVGRVMLVTATAMLAAGSIGSTLALWREKTFQTLAIVVLALVLWLGLGEAVTHGMFGAQWRGVPAEAWSEAISPWRAVLAAARPMAATDYLLPLAGGTVSLFAIVACSLAVLTNAVAIVRVRAWNSSSEPQRTAETGAWDSIWSQPTEQPAASGLREPVAEPARSVHAAPGTTRPVWDNPILWREMRTWAYGRRTALVRLAYLALCVASAWLLYSAAASETGITRGAAALALVPLTLISLILINAQAVTSLTTERDLKALDLLLVTDLTAKEFVFGKIGGVLYNVKEMIVLPMLLCGYVGWTGAVSAEDLFYLLGSLGVLVSFVTMLGIHAGLTFESSRSAIGVSLGTVFFLFVGVATCMRVMIAFAGSFEVQLQPFFAFMLGGFVGLYCALGARNASPAIGLASLALPLATFYAITIYWLEYTLGVFLVIAAAYGFTTAAMLVPAIFEFDAAVGRTSGGE